MRRVIRVIPLYWIASTCYLLTLYVAHEEAGLTLRHVIASYLLVPDPEPQDGAYFPFLFVGWTLQFEMFFYVVFAATMVWRRSVAVSAACGFMLAYLVVGQVTTFYPPFDNWANSLVLEFVGGCLLAEAYIRGLRLSLVVCLGLVAFAIGTVAVVSSELGGWPPVRGILFGLPATALVAAATLRREVSAWRFEAVMQRLGDTSYSLYLVHLLVFTAMFHVLHGIFRHWNLVPAPLYVLLLIGLSIAAAFLSFRYVEKPTTSRLRRLLPQTERL